MLAQPAQRAVVKADVPRGNAIDTDTLRSKFHSKCLAERHYSAFARAVIARILTLACNVRSNGAHEDYAAASCVVVRWILASHLRRSQLRGEVRAKEVDVHTPRYGYRIPLEEGLVRTDARCGHSVAHNQFSTGVDRID